MLEKLTGIPPDFQTKTTSMNVIPWQNDHNALRDIQIILTRLGIYFLLLSLGIKCYFCISPEFLPTLSVHTTIIHTSEQMGVKPMHDAYTLVVVFFPLDSIRIKIHMCLLGNVVSPLR